MKILSFKAHRNEKNRLVKSNIYFWIKDESILQNLEKRHTRPHHEYKKLLPNLYQKLGWDLITHSYWSQKCGCSCGCSPGFRTNHMSFDDIHVTIGADDNELKNINSGGQRGENPTVPTESSGN